jgi:glycerol-3-phosphate dehydrogenase
MRRVLAERGKVRGIVAVDALGDREVEIAARAVVLAAGPWTGRLAGLPAAESGHAFALNLLVGRRLATAAVGVRAPTGPKEDPIVGGGRFIFLVPEGSATLLGTWYARADGMTTGSLVLHGTRMLLEEFQGACPALDLSQADVLDCLWGYLPLKAGRESGRSDSLADRPWIVDHGRSGGVGGMFSVEGVKYTTARHVAEEVVDRVVGALGVPADRCRTRDVRVDDAGTFDPSLEARTRRAVRDEMAVRLADVVFRRIGSAGAQSSVDAVATMARVAGSELGWPAERVTAEIEDVMRQIRSNGLPSESLA